MPDKSSVSFTQSTFLAKSERESHRLDTVVVPLWVVDGVSHPMCPVAALRSYMGCTPVISKDSLWVWADPLPACFFTTISSLLYLVIRSADPGKLPRGHEVQCLASNLAFLCSHSVEQVLDVGQWASMFSFAQWYLSHGAADEWPCPLLLPVSHWWGPVARNLGSGEGSSVSSAGFSLHFVFPLPLSYPLIVLYLCICCYSSFANFTFLHNYSIC